MNVKAQVAEVSTTVVDLTNYRVAVWDGYSRKPFQGVAVRPVDAETFELVRHNGTPERFWYADTFRVELRPLDYDY